MNDNINNIIEDSKESELKSVLDFTERFNRQRKVDVDRNWEQLYNRIHRDKKKHLFAYWFRNIAAVLLLPLIVVASYCYLKTEQLTNISDVMLETVTAYGVRTKLTLSDGSEVWLNSGSTLVYPKYFTDNERVVKLKGEAYFKVNADKKHRFDVQTVEGITVSAFGTEFNVNSYEDSPFTKATLAKGEIHVGNGHEMIELSPSEQLVYNKDNCKLEVCKVNLMVETAWKDGKLIFRRTPMNIIAEQLSRHFNVDVILKGTELYGYTYSATFTNETLAEILNLLEATAPISCTIIEPKRKHGFSFTRKKVIISMRQKQ